MRVLRGAALLVVAGALAAAASAAPTMDPRVLVIGDSVATGITWHNDAAEVVEQDLAVAWDVAVCRRVAGTSCTSDGVTPTTMLDDVAAMPSVPPTVVVELGYNDPEDQFAAEIDEAMQALIAKGATHVFWLTLRAARAPYPALDTMLEQATERWPQLSLIDWNAYSANEPQWFQDDGIHLVAAGGLAMAHLIHASLTNLLFPLHVTTAPRLERDRMVDVELRASGGTAPYTWRVSAGRPPGGLHLLSDGWLYGEPRASGSFVVSATDADGNVARRAIHVVASSRAKIELSTT
jgi:lysophospholipase L1-like esterase